MLRKNNKKNVGRRHLILNSLFLCHCISVYFRIYLFITWNKMAMKQNLKGLMQVWLILLIFNLRCIQTVYIFKDFADLIAFWLNYKQKLLCSWEMRCSELIQVFFLKNKVCKYMQNKFKHNLINKVKHLNL